MNYPTPWKQNGNAVAHEDDMSFLIHEPADVYHAQASRYLSSHQLGDFRKSPQLFRKKRLGLIADVDRPAYAVGRAAHTMILEGEPQFEAEYAVGGPINPKTGKPYGQNTKSWDDWTASHGKDVLTDSQYDLVCQMNAGVRAHAPAMELLGDGVAEGVVRTRYCDVGCQIRMDWFNPRRGIVDLKTCDDLTWFEADARRYGYAHQLAFYRAVLAEAIRENVPVHLIAVEKKEPFRCGVWQVSAEVLGITQRENEAAIERLKQCEAIDEWPTGYEDVRVFDAI